MEETQDGAASRSRKEPKLPTTYMECRHWCPPTDAKGKTRKRPNARKRESPAHVSYRVPHLMDNPPMLVGLDKDPGSVSVHRALIQDGGTREEQRRENFPYKQDWTPTTSNIFFFLFHTWTIFKI